MTFIAEIRTFPYSYTPQMEVEWLRCDGTQYRIMQYQALYSIIGSRYGGDGKTVFNVPDLRTRVAAGAGVQPATGGVRNLGDKWGTDTVTLAFANMPRHNHPLVGAFSGSASDLSGTPAETYRLSRTFNQLDYAKRAPDTTLSPRVVSVAGGVLVNNVPAAAAAHENRQPVLALTYFICALGGKYPIHS